MSELPYISASVASPETVRKAARETGMSEWAVGIVMARVRTAPPKEPTPWSTSAAKIHRRNRERQNCSIAEYEKLTVRARAHVDWLAEEDAKARQQWLDEQQRAARLQPARRS